MLTCEGVRTGCSASEDASLLLGGMSVGIAVQFNLWYNMAC